MEYEKLLRSKMALRAMACRVEQPEVMEFIGFSLSTATRLDIRLQRQRRRHAICAPAGAG